MNVSVVIPTYNRATFLKRALRSVIQQTHLPDEIIVVDDGSTDATALVVRDFDLHYIHTENGGVAKARNIGVANAQYEWIAFLDDDDEWDPHKLEYQLHFHQTTSFVCSYTDERWIYNDKERTIPKKYQKPKTNGFLQHMEYCNIAPSSVMIQKEFFMKLGGFDESFLVCEDFDLWLRILNETDFGYIDKKLLTKHGGHPNQLGFSHGLEQERIRALVKHCNGKYAHVVQKVLRTKGYRGSF